MHLSEDVLEAYELGRLNEPSITAIEEHMLLCERCQRADERVRQYLGIMRQGLRRLDPDVIFWELHLVQDGLIEMWVERTPQGRWASRRNARFYEGSVDFDSKEAASREAIDHFGRLYPQHECGKHCRGRQRTPRVPESD